MVWSFLLKYKSVVLLANAWFAGLLYLCVRVEFFFFLLSFVCLRQLINQGTSHIHNDIHGLRSNIVVISSIAL